MGSNDLCAFQMYVMLGSIFNKLTNCAGCCFRQVAELSRSSTPLAIGLGCVNDCVAISSSQVSLSIKLLLKT